MSTVRDAIKTAFQKAHVIAVGEDPIPGQYATALVTFNDMLEAWRDEGIDLGIVDAELDDTLTVDQGARRAIIYNLAVEIGNDEQAAIPAATIAIAERSASALAGRQRGVQPVRFDPALTMRGSHRRRV